MIGKTRLCVWEDPIFPPKHKACGFRDAQIITQAKDYHGRTLHLKALRLEVLGIDYPRKPREVDLEILLPLLAH